MQTKSLRTGLWVVVAVTAVFFFLSLGFLVYQSYQGEGWTWNLVINSLLQAVPVVLLYFSVGVLAAAAWQMHAEGRLGAWLRVALYRTPRIAGVVITLFVAMFALDVFGPGLSLWQMLLGFIIHAFPAIVMGALLALAWRREWIGALAFLLAALFFLRFVFDGSGAVIYRLGMLLLFPGPMAAIALLFWANWHWRKELHPAQKAG